LPPVSFIFIFVFPVLHHQLTKNRNSTPNLTPFPPMGNIAISPSRQPQWLILSSGCRFPLTETPLSARSSSPDEVHIHCYFAFALGSERAFLSTVLCSYLSHFLLPGAPPGCRRLPSAVAASPPFSSGSLLPFLHLPGPFHRRGLPFVEPGLLPLLRRSLSFSSRPPLPYGKEAPPGPESWLSEPIPSGRRLPRGEARTAHGFSLSGSPYPGAAARRRDPALCLPIIRPRWPNLRTPTMAEAPEMFLYLSVGRAATGLMRSRRCQ
jgi:hypothetical protein